MRTMVAIALFAIVPALSTAKAEGPHVHGQARLDVVVEGTRLSLELDAPLDGLVGFERAPRDARERAALDGAIEYLQAGKGFVPSPAAGCKLASATVRTPERGRGHRGLEGKLAYECANPGELKEVEVALLREFKRLKRVDARIVTRKGQAAGRVTPAAPTLRL